MVGAAVPPMRVGPAVSDAPLGDLVPEAAAVRRMIDMAGTVIVLERVTDDLLGRLAPFTHEYSVTPDLSRTNPVWAMLADTLVEPTFTIRSDRPPLLYVGTA